MKHLEHVGEHRRAYVGLAVVTVVPRIFARLSEVFLISYRKVDASRGSDLDSVLPIYR